MSEGLSFQSFAGKIGVSFKTLYNWLDQHEEWIEAKDRGHAKALLFFEQEMIRGLWNPERGDKFNTTAWIFAMKNKFGWSDKPDEPVDDEDEVYARPESMR
jgi:transposase